MRKPLLLLLGLALFAISAQAEPAAEYAALQKWQFASTPIPVPAGGITIARDTAIWTLTSGTVRLMQPTSDGRITGLVFEGDGHFKMVVPDRYELAQLRRFAAKPELQTIDEPITQLVVRTSDDTINKLFPNAAASAYASNPIAQKRHESWLIDTASDIDARIVAAMANPGGMAFVADAKTANFDWLTYDYDSDSNEEITLTRIRAGFPEIWVSLDRPEDRTPQGRPGDRDPWVASLKNIDVKADLTRMGRTGEVGTQHQRTINGHYIIDETIEPLAEGARVLMMEVPSTAQNLTVTENGAPLTVLRDHVGARSASIDNNVYEPYAQIVLPSPLKKGGTRHLVFEYDLETPNYAPGGDWYPAFSGAFGQRHTAKLELTVNKKNEVRSMGKMESRREDGNKEVSVWTIDKPTKMVTFSTATRFEEVKVDPGNIPPVISFGPSFQMDNKNKVRNVAADVANSLQWYQMMLQDKVDDFPQFYVTSIAGNHGQAFDGFLHMSEYTYTGEHPGASELFRAHEVAHEWWGHKIGWKSYRDQWLSEAFAEYMSMMFVQGFVKGGDGFFKEILDSYEGVIMGNLKGGFSKFSRPWLVEFNDSYRARLGPIGHGRRAGTFEIPYGYMVQTYYKGPLVLHMLRMLLLYKTNSDEMFVKVLRDFAHEYAGKEASTADFRRVLERDAPGNWEFFFDQWIDSAEIPSYRWNYQVKPNAEGTYDVVVNVKRTGVRDDAMIVIPLMLQFPDGRVSMAFLTNKKNEETIVRKSPMQPKNVVFAPEHSLLANIRRD